MRYLIPHFIQEQFQKGVFGGEFQAATLFVDLSGFTSLTETLMQHRKDGAEVLGETLETIFAPLVSQVYARGGMIPLFAGDAFTALFPHNPESTPDAPLHALQTAFAIQESFPSEGAQRVLNTRYGEFAIGVKVGLSYGRVQWGIPGQGGRFSFYFRGAAVDGCALAQQQVAQAGPGVGQIAADDLILPWLGDVVTSQPIPNSHCRRLISTSLDLPTLAASQPALTRADLAPFVPDAILDLVAKAEFREACPVFLSFEEPVDEAALHEFLAVVMALAEGYGGTLSQIDFGDKGAYVVVWFGAPVAYENNVERAAECLLALQRQDPSPRWRAGLTFGTVWAGIRGGVERCEYGLIGDVVNLAARLAMNAGWGELWASAAVYEQLGDRYSLVPRGTVRVKGKQQEVMVHILLGREERAESGLYQGEMVGRQDELEQLAAAIEPIYEGRFAGLITVHGEPGAGKSRLVHELRQRTERGKGVRWLFCPADQILRQSLNPFRRLLRHTFDQSHDRSVGANRARFDTVLEALIADLEGGVAPAAALAEELRRTRSFLGALVDLRWEGSLYEQLDPVLRFENTLAALKALILAMSVHQPVIVQVEDLQWLDADSERLIQLLARNVADYPLAVVCTSRYRDDGGWVVLGVDPDVPQYVMELDALSPQGIRALAAEMLGGEITGNLAATLVEKTEGNPFFAQQLLLDLRERSMLVRADGGPWSVAGERMADVPATINSVLMARLDRLVAQVREVVQTAAVLGREFEVEVLARMLRGDEQVLDRVRQAEVERIWTALSELRYLFRHALLRDVAYDMQLRTRLRALHRLAGEAIEQVYGADLAPHYPDLAYHFGQAGEAEQERRYAGLAGERAASHFANDEAVRHLSRALELTPESDREARYRLLLAREQVHDLQGDRQAHSQDLEALEGLAAALGEAPRQGQVALRQARYGEATGDYLAAALAAFEVIRLAHAVGDADLEAAGHRQWGRALWRQGDLQAAWSQLEEALKLALLASSQRVEAGTLRDLGVVCAQSADYVMARVYLERALDLCREMGDRRGEGMVLNNLGIAARLQGDYAQARACTEQSLRIRREIGDRRGEGAVVSSLGVIQRHLGEYAQALISFEQAVHTSREVGDRWTEGRALDNLGNVFRDVGEYTWARHCYEESLRVGAELDDRRSDLVSLSNLGSLCNLENDYAKAKEYLERSLSICQDMGDPEGKAYVWTSLGRSHLGRGDLEEAAAAFQQAVALRRKLGQDHLAMESLAGLADVSLARGDLAQALAQVEEILSYLESGTLAGTEECQGVYLTCYQALCAVQDPRSREVLDAAHTLLQARAARIPTEEMRRSYLEKVPAHRKIAAAWQAYHGTAEP